MKIFNPVKLSVTLVVSLFCFVSAASADQWVQTLNYNIQANGVNFQEWDNDPLTPDTFAWAAFTEEGSLITIGTREIKSQQNYPACTGPLGNVAFVADYKINGVIVGTRYECFLSTQVYLVIRNGVTWTGTSTCSGVC